jgi:hypothetical protein
VGQQPFDLTEVARVKEYLGVTTSSDDDLIQRLIASASAFARTYVSRDLTKTDYDQWFNGNGQPRLMLPQFPVISVTTVEVDGRAVPQALTPISSGWLFDDNMIYLRNFVFNRGFQNVHVVYTAGIEGPMPLDLEQAVIELVGEGLKKRTRLGKQSESLNGQSITYTTKDLPDAIKLVFDQYQRVFPV